MSWVLVAILAVLLPIVVVLALSVVMWMVRAEERLVEGHPEPNPTRAVTFERNIPGSDTGNTE